MSEIAVSVVCHTYNQRDYIRDALEGFLMQKTSFIYEILIHDDASTDGTREFLKEYQQRYPEKIRLILESENQYSKGIDIAKDIILPRARGKYTAFCEGDDYWIYNRKLQEQYELMESDPNIALCYHNALKYEEQKDTLRLSVNNHSSGYIEDRDIICASKGWYPTASILARTDFLKERPDFKGATRDVIWRTYMACRGKLYFLNRAWSVYRECAKGSWNEKYCNDKKVAAEYIVKTVDYFTKFDIYSKGRFSEYLHVVYMASITRFFSINYPNGYRVEQLEKELTELKQLSFHRVDHVLDMFHDQYIIHCNDYYEVTVSNKIKRLYHDGEKIYIYGAGAEAIKAIVSLTEHDIQISGLIVSAKKEEKSALLGIPIYSIKEIDFNSCVFIWPCLINGRKDVLNDLKQMSSCQIII